MAEAKHTPAPWRFLPKVGHLMGADGESQFGPIEVQIGVVGNYRDDELLPFNRERWDADGHLISAAPDMLAALQAAMLLLREYDFPGAHPHRKAIYDQAKAAIAKATGERTVHS